MPLPNQPSPTQTKNPAVIMTLIALVIGAGAGYMAASGPQRKAGYDAGYADGTAAGVAQAKKTITAVVDIKNDPVLKEVDGIVKSIGNGVLTIETHLQSADPFAAPVPTTRTVRLASSTKLTVSMEKKPEDLQKEMEAYRKSQEAALAPVADLTNAPAPAARPAVPSPTSEETITIDKITVGSAVVVTAENDVFRAETIDATSVRVITLASADSTPPQLAPLPKPDHAPSPDAAPIVPPAPATVPPKPILNPPHN
ncbi:MAG: hypothetical protein RL272_319 [Candidatus Parcubacteria bacterium]|jgi:hypothetical protein